MLGIYSILENILLGELLTILPLIKLIKELILLPTANNDKDETLNTFLNKDSKFNLPDILYLPLRNGNLLRLNRRKANNLIGITPNLKKQRINYKANIAITLITVKDRDLEPTFEIDFYILSITIGKIRYLLKLYKEVVKRNDFKEEWYLAMKEQVDKLKVFGIWDFVNLLNGVKIILGKWVLDQKFIVVSEWLKNRAKWVVCGNFEYSNYMPYEVYFIIVYTLSVRIFIIFIASIDLEYR